jgi:hypothetical protein
MTKVRSNLRACLAVLGVAGTATLAPLSVSPRGVRLQVAACQSGTCCPEDRTMCIVGTSEVPDHYFKSSGSCKLPPPDQ